MKEQKLKMGDMVFNLYEQSFGIIIEKRNVHENGIMFNILNFKVNLFHQYSYFVSPCWLKKI